MKETKASKHRKQGNIFQFIREEKNSPVCMGCGILEQSQLFMKSSVFFFFFMRPGSPLEVLAVYSMYDFCQVTLQLLLFRCLTSASKGFIPYLLAIVMLAIWQICCTIVSASLNITPVSGTTVHFFTGSAILGKGVFFCVIIRRW